MSLLLGESECLEKGGGLFRSDNTPVTPETQLETLLLKYTNTAKISTDKSKLQDLLQRTDDKLRIELLSSVTDKVGKTIMHCGAERNHPKTIQYVLDALQKEERVRLLLQTDNQGRTALHCSAMNGNKSPIAVMLQSLELSDWQMRFLLAKTNDGEGALNMANRRRKTECVCELKRWLASVEARLDTREIETGNKIHDPGDDIWVLELRGQEKRQLYKKLLAEYRKQLNHSIRFSLEDVEGYQKRLTTLTNNLTQLEKDATGCGDQVEQNPGINESCKETFLRRLEEIQQQCGQIQREMEVLGRELDSKRDSALQEQRILQLEALLRDTSEEQSTRISTVDSNVNAISRVQQRHGQRLAAAESELETLSYTPGGLQPLEEDEISLATASQETSDASFY